MTMTVLHAFDGMNVRKDPDTGQEVFYEVKKANTFLTKRVSSAGTMHAQNMRKYEVGKFYDPQTLGELRPLLDEWAVDPHAMIIRQSYKDHEVGRKAYRNKTLYKYTESKLVCIDIDELPLPNYIAKNDIRSQAAYAVNILSKCAEEIPDDIEYIAQGSSSAGFSNKIKLHLWIANDTALSHAAAKSYLREINEKYKEKYETKENLVDLALYNIGQPHYLAKPIFIDIEDPIEERTVYEYGGICHIPNKYEDLFHAPTITKVKREKHLEMIEGSKEPSFALSERIAKLESWEPRDSGARTAVIATFHKAYQENFCLEELSKLLYPILTKIRCGRELDYLAQGKNAAIQEGYNGYNRDLSDKSLNLPVTVQDTNEEYYLKLARLPEANTILFLKASLGTGKTSNIVRLLKQESGSFLTITNNTALVASNAADFGAGLYSKETDMLDLASGNRNKMSTTIHSLWKFKDYSFDFIFLDEADATINDLLNASIISEPRKEQIREALISLFSKSKVIILSDGDLSQETLDAYTSLTEGEKKLVKVVHKRDNLANAYAIEHKSINSVLGAMEACLSNGERCLLVSDLSPRKLNSYLHTFERVLPDRRGVVMHAQSKEDEEFKDIVTNTNDALIKRGVDYLLASPSITNGVDFKYFDVIFVVTTSATQSPNMRFQALKREREAKKVHFYLGRVDGYNSGYSQVNTKPDGWWEYYRRLFDARKERECKNYGTTFRLYLTEAGCRIIYEDEGYITPQNSEDKKLALEEEALAIFEGVNKPRFNLAEEQNKMIKFFCEDPDYDYILEFLSNRIYEKSEMLSKVIDEFWDVLKLRDAEKLLDVLSSDRGYRFNKLSGIPLPPNRRNREVKIRMSADILKRLGLDNELDVVIEHYCCYCKYNDLPISEVIEVEKTETATDLGVV